MSQDQKTKRFSLSEPLAIIIAALIGGVFLIITNSDSNSTVNNPTPTHTQIDATTTDVPIATLPPICPTRQLQEDIVYDVQPGAIVFGDVYVNGDRQFDMPGEVEEHLYPEGTLVFYEEAGQVLAPDGASCIIGDKSELDQLVEGQFTTGCDTGCGSVRLVIVEPGGKPPNVAYFSPEGQLDLP